jgi:hypothetical protein
MPIAEIAGITSTAKNAVDTLDRLDVLEKVKNKLFNNPDRAAKHLVRVLSEIEVVYRELERQILILSTLEFEPARELRKSRTYLRRLKNQGLRKQIPRRPEQLWTNQEHPSTLPDWMVQPCTEQEGSTVFELAVRSHVHPGRQSGGRNVGPLRQAESGGGTNSNGSRRE